MAVEKARWLSRRFRPSGPTHWFCPFCEYGALMAEPAATQVKETLRSERVPREDGWEPDWIEEVFTCFLKCNTCGESAVACGRAHQTQYEEPEISSGTAWGSEFQPHSIVPAPPIFRPPRKLPKRISEALDRAFAAFWSDLDSCATRVRVVLELILDELKVPRAGRNRQFLSLHRRIERLRAKPKYAGYCDTMLAMKWLGNEGTHEGSLTEGDILDGFDLLAHLLTELFDDGPKIRERVTRELIKYKGKRRRKRPPF